MGGINGYTDLQWDVKGNKFTYNLGNKISLFMELDWLYYLRL